MSLPNVVPCDALLSVCVFITFLVAITKCWTKANDEMKDLWFEDAVGRGREATVMWGAKHSLCNVKFKRLTFAKKEVPA